MGWMGTFVSYEPTAQTIKNIIKNEFEFEGEKHTFKIIQHSVVGREHYLAVAKTQKGIENCIPYVFGVVVLTSVQKRNDGSWEVMYKDMDESMGPYYYNAPVNLINKLSPTQDEYANIWRGKCRETAKMNSLYRTKKKLVWTVTRGLEFPNLKVGDKITLEWNKRYKCYCSMVGYQVTRFSKNILFAYGELAEAK